MRELFFAAGRIIWMDTLFQGAIVQPQRLCDLVDGVLF